MPNKPELLQISITTEDKETAEKIALTLVEEKLAACVQISQPIKSYYRWEGKVEQSTEYLCLIKSRVRLFNQLKDRVEEIHPYEVPEIIATPITRGNQDYLDWVCGQLS